MPERKLKIETAIGPATTENIYSLEQVLVPNGDVNLLTYYVREALERGGAVSITTVEEPDEMPGYHVEVSAR